MQPQLNPIARLVSGNLQLVVDLQSARDHSSFDLLTAAHGHLDVSVVCVHYNLRLAGDRIAMSPIVRVEWDSREGEQYG